MPGLDSLTVKQMLNALKLYHADIAVPKPDDSGFDIGLTNERQPISGDPSAREPGQINIGQAEAYLPKPTAPERQAAPTPAISADPRAETLQKLRGEYVPPPATEPHMRARTTVEAINDFGRDVGHTIGEFPLFKFTDKLGLTTFGDERPYTDPTAAYELKMGDPGAPIEGTLGNLAKGGASKLSASAQKALAKALDTVEQPALRAQLEQLANRYPQLAKAIGTHGATTTLEGRNRSLAAAFDRVAQVTHDMVRAEGGASIRPLTGETAKVGETPGWMAGKYANQSGKTAAIPLSQFTPADVSRYMEKHADTLAKDPKLYVGGWLDKNSNTVYLDISKQHESARQAVINAAYQRQPKGTVRDPVTGAWPKAQEAVFNPKNAKEVPVGNFAEFVGSPAFQQRLDEMFEVGNKVMNGKDWWNLYGSDLERVYGKERVAPLAAMLASTSPASAPVHNLRSASEYLRRMIKEEPVIQSGFRIPETAIGSREGMMGAQTTGDFNAPGTKMPMERTRAPNLQRAAEFDYAAAKPGEGPRMMEDKVNDMFHALTGMDVGVYDRRYAKLAEDWEQGIYAESTKDKLKGSMKSGQVGSYALIENALRDGAKRHGMNLSTFTANVWEGIGETIKKTGKLYGMKQQAHSIPEASLGFPGIFNAMVAEKAKAWGVTVEEFEKRLRNGDAELLTAILATPVGLAAYKKYLRENPPTETAGGAQ